MVTSGFRLFGPIKIFVSGKKFPSDDELKHALQRGLISKPKVFHASELLKLIHPLDKFLNTHVSYALLKVLSKLSRNSTVFKGNGYLSKLLSKVDYFIDNIMVNKVKL